MGDELLDEATRLADDWRATREGDVLRALVERVEEAEAALVSAIAGTYAEDERMLRRDAERAEEVVRAELKQARAAWSQDAHLRDAALDRLDAVRAALDANVPAWSYDLAALRGHLRSIIDGDGSVRPADARGDDPAPPGPEPR